MLPHPPQSSVGKSAFKLAWKDIDAVPKQRRTPKEVSRARPDLRLPELCEGWIEARQPAPKSIYCAQQAVSQFVALIGNIPVQEIGTDDLMRYRDALKNFPASLNRKERSTPFHVLAQRFACRRPNRARLKPGSIAKLVRQIQCLLAFGHQERWIENARAHRIPLISHCDNPRRPFLREELASLFALDLFTRPWSKRTDNPRISADTLRWLFLIGLMTGARVEEIGQADLDDVVRTDGSWFLRIDSYDARGMSSGKSIKTPYSRRHVPIHSRLIELGFLERVERLRKAGRIKLMPDLKRDRFERYTNDASRYLNRIINRVQPSAGVCFHSLRHNFKDMTRSAGMLEYVSDQITGHAPQTMGGRYGRGVPFPVLAKEIERLKFDLIDWKTIIVASRT